MPQAPLPPLAQRLAPTNLISPIVRGTPTPMDVIQHQQLIDYMARFKEGIDAAQDLTRSRMVAKQSAAQAHAADVMGRENKNLDAYLKKIDNSNMSPGDKQFWSQMAIYTSGYSATPEGGSMSGQNIGNIYQTIGRDWPSNPPPGGVVQGIRNYLPFPQFDNSGNVVNQTQSGTPPAPPISTDAAAAKKVPSAPTTTTNTNDANAANTGDTEQFY